MKHCRRMMGLKQKERQIQILNMRHEQHKMYSICTVYQGLNEKHNDIWCELKPLPSDPTVTDEMLL